eukprot:365807-Chlamydomonas_euryale.AAC.16
MAVGPTWRGQDFKSGRLWLICEPCPCASRIATMSPSCITAVLCQGGWRRGGERVAIRAVAVERQLPCSSGSGCAQWSGL